MGQTAAVSTSKFGALSRRQVSDACYEKVSDVEKWANRGEAHTRDTIAFVKETFASIAKLTGYRQHLRGVANWIL